MRKKEVLALVNTEPNTRFSNTHKDLTLINKPEAVDEIGIYQLEEKEKAVEDLKWHKAETGGHIGLKKLTIEDVEVENL